MTPMLLPIDQIIGRVLEMRIGPRRPIWHLDPHQNVFPMNPRIHSPPQLDPPQLFPAADLKRCQGEVASG